MGIGSCLSYGLETSQFSNTGVSGSQISAKNQIKFSTDFLMASEPHQDIYGKSWLSSSKNNNNLLYQYKLIIKYDFEHPGKTALYCIEYITKTDLSLDFRIIILEMVVK